MFWLPWGSLLYFNQTKGQIGVVGQPEGHLRVCISLQEGTLVHVLSPQLKCVFLNNRAKIEQVEMYLNNRRQTNSLNKQLNKISVHVVVCMSLKVFNYSLK